MKRFISLAVIVILAANLFVTPVAQAWSSDAYTEWEHGKLYKGRTSDAAYIDPLPRASVTLRGREGTWTSPIVTTKKPFDSINPSWQADTPQGSSMAVELRVRGDGRWSNWYKMGNWAFENTANFSRTSLNDQSDAFGSVYTDTYVNTSDKRADAYQLRVKLSATTAAKPRVFQLASQTATSRTFENVSKAIITERTVDLPVPMFSQYTHEGEYPAFGGGGEAWCSPTSVAMILKYYGKGPDTTAIASLPADPKFDANGRKDGEVPYAAIHTYDKAYKGTGNWPFNTAYAAAYGIRSSVRVFDSLRDIEKEILRGNPVVTSIAWNNTDQDATNDLPNAGTEKTSGHLMVVRGFTKTGDVIANDPATHKGNSDVRRAYDRAAFERQWINSSNGTTYTFDH